MLKKDVNILGRLSQPSNRISHGVCACRVETRPTSSVPRRRRGRENENMAGGGSGGGGENRGGGRDKNRLCSKTCGKEMNTHREKIKGKNENLNRKVPKERKKT